MSIHSSVQNFDAYMQHRPVTAKVITPRVLTLQESNAIKIKHKIEQERTNPKTQPETPMQWKQFFAWKPLFQQGKTTKLFSEMNKIDRFNLLPKEQPIPEVKPKIPSLKKTKIF